MQFSVSPLKCDGICLHNPYNFNCLLLSLVIQFSTNIKSNTTWIFMSKIRIKNVKV